MKGRSGHGAAFVRFTPFPEMPGTCYAPPHDH